MSLKDAFQDLKQDLQSNNQNGSESTNKKKSTDNTNKTPDSIDNSKQPERKLGKRSDPDYFQSAVYIKKETHRQAKIALLQQNDFEDYSDLVEHLLSQWIKEQANK